MRWIRRPRPVVLLLSAVLWLTVGGAGPWVVGGSTGAAACRLGIEGTASGNDGDFPSAVASDGSRGFWSVGIHYDGGDGSALAMRSSAGGWHPIPVPLPRGESESAQLVDVAALTPQDAWAVGVNGPGRIVILHWDGIAWRYVPQPLDVASGRGLLAVSAHSASDVWAVGRSSRGPVVTTLVEHWDGSAWSVVPSPSPSPYLNVLEDVVAIGPSDVWAVGYTVRGGRFRTLVEHWSEGGWTVVGSPDVAADDDALMSIAAVGPDDAWAVGWSGGASDETQGLSLHWDGRSWSLVDVPSQDPARTRLLGVTIAPGGPVAVGQEADQDSSLRPLALRWTGRTWTRIAVDPVEATDASLVGVASGGSVVAVGTGQFAVGFASIVVGGC
jgi:hypothetical protein